LPRSAKNVTREKEIKKKNQGASMQRYQKEGNGKNSIATARTGGWGKGMHRRKRRQKDGHQLTATGRSSEATNPDSQPAREDDSYDHVRNGILERGKSLN